MEKSKGHSMLRHYIITFLQSWVDPNLTWHRLGYFRAHDRLKGGGGQIRSSPAVSRTNGRIEPWEAAFESSP